MIRYMLCFLLAVSMLPVSAAQPDDSQAAAVFFVSVQGRDTWSGKRAVPAGDNSDGPFRTLMRARDAIRDMKKNGSLPKGGVAVEIGKGLYELAETLILGADDSGTDDSPVVYRGVAGEKPMVVGGKRIKNFVPYKNKIMKADVSGDFGDTYFRQLFFNGRRQHLARYPNYDANNPYGGGWSYVAGSMADKDKADSKRVITCREGTIHSWADPSEGEVFIFPGPNYRNNVIPIESVDAAKRTITLKRDADYVILPVDRFYVRNLIEELDAPGEWFLDRKTKTLYFWPPDDITAGAAYAPTLDKMIVVSNAANIIIRGLVLECADDAAVTVVESRDCLVAGNIIRNVTGRTSGMGAVVVTGGSNVGVVGNDIYDVGTTAIHLSGGERTNLIPASHYAENNYIHHVGVVYTRGVGVNIDGVGQRVSRNLIHDCPRFALIFYGNDHIIELNRLRHMNTQTEDTGATYCWGRDFLTARGSVIRYNFISDSLGYGKKLDTWMSPYYAWGIYLDDDCSGVDVIGNIVMNANRAGIHFHNARDIIASNNVFINNGTHDLEMNGWTATHKFFINNSNNFDRSWKTFAHLPAWQKYRGLGKAPPLEAGFMVDNVIVNNIFYNTNEKANVFSIRNFAYDRTTFDRNVVWHPNGALTVQGVKADPDKQWDEWKRLGFDNNSVVADPGFINITKGDFRLKPDSPALALGFQQLPVERIGPYEDRLRASWPIVEAEGVREHPITQIEAPKAVKIAADNTRLTAGRVHAAFVDGAVTPTEYPREPVAMQYSPNRKKLDTVPCELRMCHDTKQLYVAVTVPLKDAGRLSQGDTWGKNDGVEICFAAITEGTPMGDAYILRGFSDGTFAVSSDGGVSAKAAAAVREGASYAAVVGAQSWTAEFAVPLTSFGVNYAPGARLGFNTGVRRTENNEWVVWIGAMGATHKLENGGVAVLE